MQHYVFCNLVCRYHIFSLCDYPSFTFSIKVKKEKDGLLTHQSDEWVRVAEGEEEREKELQKEMGKEFRLLTDGCQSGAEVLLRAVIAQAVCVYVFVQVLRHLCICTFVALHGFESLCNLICRYVVSVCTVFLTICTICV